MYPYQLSRRYENAWAAFTHIVITSNWSPAQQWHALKSAAPLSAPLVEEDRIAFLRRFTHVLHVDEHGTITDETQTTAALTADRPFITLNQFKAVLAHGGVVPPDVKPNADHVQVDLLDGT